MKARGRQRLYSIGGAVMAFSALVTTVGTGVTSQAVAATATAVPKVPTPPTIQWSPCTDQILEAYHAQCGYVSVPLDYGQPKGAHIKIAVSKIKHTSSKADYQGDILTNPGGPGGSGLDLNPYLIEPRTTTRRPRTSSTTGCPSRSPTPRHAMTKVPSSPLSCTT